MREEAVVALDGQDRLPRRRLVAVAQGVHDQPVPAGLPAPAVAVPRVAPGAQTQRRQRLVHAAEHGVLALLEDLHGDARVQVLLQQDLAGAVEVGVGVVPLADGVYGEGEEVRREALGRHGRECTPASPVARSRPAQTPSLPRVVSSTRPGVTSKRST